MAGVVRTVGVGDGVGSGPKLQRLGPGRPALPVAGARQVSPRDLAAVDRHAQCLGALERVRSVGVAQSDVVGAALLHGDVEGGGRTLGTVAVDEPAARVAGVVGVDRRAARELRLLGLVRGDRWFRTGDAVQRVPRLGAPQRLTVGGGERPGRAHVHDPVGLQTRDRQRDLPAVLRQGRRRDGQSLLVDLRTAVARRRHVPPLGDSVVRRQVPRGLLRQRPGVLQFEPARHRAHGEDVERVVTGGSQLLQAVGELARLAPVAARAEAAEIDRTVRAPRDPVDPDLESLGHAEDRALVLALHLLQVRALNTPVGDVTEQHLSGERTLLDVQRGAGGVRDLVLRQPQHRLGDRLVVEGTVRIGVVVEEAVLLDVDEFGRGQPAALVVGDEDVPAGPPADAVRGAETTRDVGHLAGPAVHLDGGAAVLRGLRVGGGATVVDRHGEVQVEEPVPVEQAEGELVEVVAERPGRHRVVLVDDVVAVDVHQFGQLVFLRHVDGAVDDLEPHGLLQPLGDAGDRHLLRAGVAGDVVQQVDLAGDVVGATPRRDGQPAVGHPVHRRHLGLEALGAQVGERVVGVHVGQGHPVARRVGAALALLAARCRDAHDVGLGAQDRVGHDLEAGRTRWPPLQRHLLLARGVEVFDEQGVGSCRQEGRALLRLGGVQAVVVDDDLAVDGQARAVVAGEPERVLAVLRNVEVGDGVGDEVVADASEVLGGAPVDVGHQPVDVGCLPGLEGADLVHRLLYVEDTQGDTRLLWGELGLRAGFLGGRCGQA